MELPPNVVLVSKSDSAPMRALGLLLGRSFMRRFWTTYRLPFQRKVRITHPPGVVRPELQGSILTHEFVHATQFSHWWGPWLIPLFVALLPLPVLFSGRWFVERDAYLLEIERGWRTVDEAVEILWTAYLWPWPRPLMRRWFLSRLREPRPLGSLPPC